MRLANVVLKFLLIALEIVVELFRIVTLGRSRCGRYDDGRGSSEFG
jgi:hypothetical protein